MFVTILIKKHFIIKKRRLTPQLLIVLLFYSWIWENMGNGPQWGDIVSENADLCKQSMWKNVFFVQNLFPFEKMVS